MISQCQLMASYVIKNKIQHYHGAIEIDSKADLEILKKFQGKEGFFIKKFLISDKFNANRWRVTWDAILQDVKGFIGQPIVLTPDKDHPPVAIQDDYKVGEILEVEIDEMFHKVYQYSEITDPVAQQMILDEEIEFGSPTVVIYDEETRDEVELGNGRIETTLHRFVPAQDALVGNPAYGKEVDNIPAVCTGDGPGCAMKLLSVSASVKDDVINDDWRKFVGAINDDNTNQLTIVPFVKKTVNSRYSSEDLAIIVGKIENANEADLDSCVERKIKILRDEHSDWDNDQIVAVAFSYCRESAMEAEFCTTDLDNLTHKENQFKNSLEELQNKLN